MNVRIGARGLLLVWAGIVSVCLGDQDAVAQYLDDPSAPATEVIHMEVFWDRVFYASTGRFPAISEDGTEVAILLSGLDFVDDHSITVDIRQTADGRSIRRYELQHKHEDAHSEDQAFRKQLVGRLGEPNAYLAQKRFQPMMPLYRMPTTGLPGMCYPYPSCHSAAALEVNPRRSPAVVVSEGKRIAFDYDAGVLSIGNVDGATGELVRSWPIRESRSGGSASADCDVQAIPYQGWIGEDIASGRGRVAVLRVGYMAAAGCEQADEWRIEHVH